MRSDRLRSERLRIMTLLMMISIKHASSYRRLAKTVKKRNLEKYLKEKWKEEQKNFISINAVVNLTSDRCFLESRKVSCIKNISKWWWWHRACQWQRRYRSLLWMIKSCQDADSSCFQFKIKVDETTIKLKNSASTLLERNDWSAMKIKLHCFSEKNNVIRVLDSIEKNFKNVDVRISLKLTRIMNSKNSKFRILHQMLHSTSLSYYIYHEDNRNQNINYLSQFDIIITTYFTNCCL